MSKCKTECLVMLSSRKKNMGRHKGRRGDERKDDDFSVEYVVLTCCHSSYRIVQETSRDGKTQLNYEQGDKKPLELPERMQASIREAWKNVVTSSEKQHLEKEMSFIVDIHIKYIESRKDCWS